MMLTAKTNTDAVSQTGDHKGLLTKPSITFEHNSFHLNNSRASLKGWISSAKFLATPPLLETVKHPPASPRVLSH